MRKHPIFEHLHDDILKMMRDKQLVVIKKDDWLFHQNEESDGMYVILLGQIDIVAEGEGENHILATLEKGAIIGEVGLLTDAPRMAGAKAIEHTELIFIQADKLREQINKEDMTAFWIIYNISLILAQRLQKSSNHLLKVKSKIKNTSKEIAEFRKKLISDITI